MLCPYVSDCEWYYESFRTVSEKLTVLDKDVECCETGVVIPSGFPVYVQTVHYPVMMDYFDPSLYNDDLPPDCYDEEFSDEELERREEEYYYRGEEAFMREFGFTRNEHGTIVCEDVYYQHPISRELARTANLDFFGSCGIEYGLLTSFIERNRLVRKNPGDQKLAAWLEFAHCVLVYLWKHKKASYMHPSVTVSKALEYGNTAEWEESEEDYIGCIEYYEAM